MSESATEPEATPPHLERITEVLGSGTQHQVVQLLNALHPAEIAGLLESMPPPQREAVWELVPSELDGEVLLHVNDEVRSGLLVGMDSSEIVAATSGMDVDDLADLLQELPEALLSEVLRAMDRQNRKRVEEVLSYPEDTAGGLMNTDVVTVRADVTLDVVLRYLRMRGELPQLTDMLFVLSRSERYVGTLPLQALVTHALDLTVAEVMGRDLEAVPVDLPQDQIARRFEDRDLVSAPVVDDNGHLLGRITIDDVVDVIRDEADHTILSTVGLDEEDDMFAPVVSSSRRRAVWLGINLITAFMAAWVIGLFEATIQQVVALAVLMPVVASMGGIAGSQTLTLMIRGLATGRVSASNVRWLLRKEMAVGALNGLLWAIVIALVAVAWFQDLRIGGIIAAAIVLNLLSAALSGITIPLALKRLGIDPALAGSVVLTTVTDIVGFMAFLGLATLWLL
jgi:magnesium transporter